MATEMARHNRERERRATVGKKDEGEERGPDVERWEAVICIMKMRMGGWFVGGATMHIFP
jgi:hypothetical protein